MKIIFDAEDFKNKPRGIVKTTFCLYQACLEAMPTLQFVGITRKPLAVALPKGFEIVTMRPDLPRNLWRFVMYNTYLGLHSCFAVHFPSNGLIPRIFAKRTMVMTLHDVLPLTVPGHFRREDKKRRYIKRRQHDIDRSEVIFTVSEYSKRDIMKNFHMRTEPVVLYNAPTLSPERYDPLYNIAGVQDYFLYTGGYDRRKGLNQLIRVFLGLHREKKITAQLYLTGAKSDYSEEFKDLITTAVAAGVVRELDYVSDGEMIALMKNAKGLIYPSFYEGFGLPPVDAMNIGCPVITTPFSAIPEICGDAVLYVDPDNEKEFADTIVVLDKNDAVRKEMIIKGKKQVGRYSWARSASIFLEHLTRIHAR